MTIKFEQAMGDLEDNTYVGSAPTLQGGRGHKTEKTSHAAVIPRLWTPGQDKLSEVTRIEEWQVACCVAAAPNSLSKRPVTTGCTKNFTHLFPGPATAGCC